MESTSQSHKRWRPWENHETAQNTTVQNKKTDERKVDEDRGNLQILESSAFNLSLTFPPLDTSKFCFKTKLSTKKSKVQQRPQADQPKTASSVTWEPWMPSQTESQEGKIAKVKTKVQQRPPSDQLKTASSVTWESWAPPQAESWECEIAKVKTKFKKKFTWFSCQEPNSAGPIKKEVTFAFDELLKEYEAILVKKLDGNPIFTQSEAESFQEKIFTFVKENDLKECPLPNCRIKTELGGDLFEHIIIKHLPRLNI